MHICGLLRSRDALQIVQMEEHRGKILENAIREKGYTFAAAAKRMNISRRTLYNYFDEPELAWQKIIDFDKTLLLGLTGKFTEMSKYMLSNTSDNIAVDENDPDYWKNKYIALLERYTKLLEKDI